MRSKEVEKAIDYLTKYINWETYGERSLESDIETVLNYISELEDELIEEKQLNVKYLKIREEKENIIKKISLEAQKYFDMLMEVEYGRDTLPKQKIRDKIKEIEEIKGDFATYIATSEKIQVLKELLGE